MMPAMDEQPKCSKCGAPLRGVGSGKFPGGYCEAARYGGPGHPNVSPPKRARGGVGR